MGAGRAATFDAETTDFGSVMGRSSGPVEAATGVHMLLQMATNSASNWRIRILTSFPQSPDPARWACGPHGGAPSRSRR